MSKDDERVLCVPRARLVELGLFQGAMADVEAYLPALFAAPYPLFLRRGDCEDDPNFKQLIPYLLVEHRGRLLRYLRGGKGGEARLHAKASVGIGGHVNDLDDEARVEGGVGDAQVVFAQGLQRELAEELSFDQAPELVALGLINDDVDRVGEVHLGLAFVARFADEATVAAQDEAHEGSEFLTLEEIRNRPEPLESWSQLALELYEQRAVAG